MQTQLLIDSIVRQTTVLIAQLATSGGVRAPLAHVAGQVFVELARELETQGVSRRVSADMFGIALRTYQRKTQRLRESVTVRGCFQCEQRIAQQCACYEPSESDGSATITCLSTGAPAAALRRPPCDSNACEFDGVCYSNGTGTEDGCCYCDNGMGGCDQPASCPGWVLIGKRCSSDADCSAPGGSSGLHCRADFVGERGVCTRDCNFGCPTGTECAAEVPDYNGGTIKNVCMRPCMAPADGAMEPRGHTLGSECDAPSGLTKSYCF